MVVNAAGDAQYEFMLNSSLTQNVRAINSSKDYNTLISLAHMNHLDASRNPFVSIDPRSSRKRLVTMYELFDMSEPNGPKRSLKEEYGGTDTVSIDISNMAGVAFTINDENNNGIWDNGDFNTNTQPEKIKYLTEQLTLKAYWDLEQSVLIE
jgi:hypothetical protein